MVLRVVIGVRAGRLWWGWGLWWWWGFWGGCEVVVGLLGLGCDFYTRWGCGAGGGVVAVVVGL